MLKRLFVLAAIAGLLLLPVSNVSAQSYSFRLDRELVNAYWNADGTLALDYVFTFSNDPGAHVIDFVDVGMPNGDFERGSITADAQGQTLSISSDYQGQGSGFAVDMGAHAVRPGQQGSLHVHVGRIKRVLYNDSDNPDQYASAAFSPTWFGAQYVHGATDLSVTFHLPPGVQSAEPRYHQVSGWPAPQAGFDDQGRITYTWHSAGANGSSQYTFGASFPKQYIPADAIVTAPAFDIGGGLAALAATLGAMCFPLGFCGVMLGLIVLGVINDSRRKLQYLPPKIRIEGHGIKRGLTAVEAAVLMEQPLDKVLTMILFGVIKKGAARVVSREPLKIEVTQPTDNQPLYAYETSFLKAFNLVAAQARKTELQAMLVALVKSVSEKMRGFSRRETLDYYRTVMARAWQQIEAADTPEVQSRMFDEALEWTMLDAGYDEHTRRVFAGRFYAPGWWGHYDPGYYGRGAAPAAPGGQVVLPGSNMAASLVNGVQNFSSHVIGDVSSFTSGVTNRTNPVPVSSGRSGRVGGGGHCACACACAGCACACAGGGR